MAELTRERIGQIQRGIFQILAQHPDGLRAKEVIGRLAEVVPPTPFEDQDYPNRPGVRRFDKIARFVTIGPVKAGWMKKEKGRWTLTDEGMTARARLVDPEEFAREASRLYRLWKKDQVNDEEESGEEEVSAAATLEEAQELAWAEIDAYLSELNPYDFQNLVAGLLRGMGYHVSFVAPPGPDKGVDIVAHTDPLGITGPQVKVQVKRRHDHANVDAIRAFLAVLGGGDVGLFVCTGGFTKDAEDEARGQQLRRVMLVDSVRLVDLWIEHYDGIPEEFRRLLPLRPVHYLDLE